ncbi:ribonuclease T2-like [Phlyctochytrium bullatum]|nr:ribonuclease T2-like [Phlyctochytrium bullatum]
MHKLTLALAVSAAALAASAAYCPMPSNFYCPPSAIACQNDTLTGKPYDSCCVGTDGLVVFSMNWTAGHLMNPDRRKNWFDLEKVKQQPKDVWTIHGLWPDHCDGTYSNDDRGCDYPNRYYEDVETRLKAIAPASLMEKIFTYWPSGNGDYQWFLSHEFTKHGTCLSVLDPPCYGPNYKKDQDVLDYFVASMAIFERFPLYKIFAKHSIVPSTERTYLRSEFHAALRAETGHEGGLLCARDLDAKDPKVKYFVSELFLYFINRPGLQFDHIDPIKNGFQSCPDNVPLYYLPMP